MWRTLVLRFRGVEGQHGRGGGRAVVIPRHCREMKPVRHCGAHFTGAVRANRQKGACRAEILGAGTFGAGDVDWVLVLVRDVGPRLGDWRER